MKLYVIFAQRKQRYEGEYGLEALTCMSEADNESNPDYLPEELEKHRNSKDFDAVEVVTLDLSEKTVREILFPQHTPIPASVVPPKGPQ